jgi:hypothetical protein
VTARASAARAPIQAQPNPWSSRYLTMSIVVRQVMFGNHQLQES